MVSPLLLTPPALLVILAGAVMGLVLGSFLNVVIYRLPLMLKRRWESEAALILAENNPDLNQASENAGSMESPKDKGTQPEPFNLAVPASHCPSCGHKITWRENIPLFSYIVQRGRCKACNAAISLRYPIVELITGTLWAICAWRWGLSWTTLAWCGFSSMLLVITYIDWDTTLLPDELSLPLLWAGLIVAALGLTDIALTNALWGAVAGYLSLWLIYWCFLLITGKEGMGYGDFKLFAALGAWFGWKGLLPVILIASVVGVIVGLWLKYTKHLRQGGVVPFGPFLSLGGLVAMFIGVNTLLAFFGL
jgi:leader peptidase (prepilin peptidase)/N-methyltransferase